jgi:hypothetical protein
MSGRPRPEVADGDAKAEWGRYARPGDIRGSRFHDCLGLVVFAALLAVSIALLAVGIARGRPWVLTHSWDETGNFCGVDNTALADEVANLGGFALRDYGDRPFLFFGAGRAVLGLGDGDPRLEPPGQRQYCVRACPTAEALGAAPQELYVLAFADACDNASRICPPWLTAAQREENARPGGLCVCPYPTYPLFGRCVPLVDEQAIGAELVGNVTAILRSLKNILFALPGLGQGLTATVDLAPTVALWVVLSFVIGVVWTLLLRCVAPAIVYLIAVLVPVVIAVLGIWLWFYGEHSFFFRDEGDSHRICAGICFAIAVVIAAIVLFLWSRLKAAVAIIGMAGRALWGNLTALAAPLISLVLLAVFWALSLTSAVFNYAAADFTIGNRTSVFVGLEEDTPFLTMSLDHDLEYVLIYILVYLIFISVHVYFTNFYAQSSAIVEWYFQGASSGPCNCRCLYGFLLAFTKGLGTIALCALIMTPLYILILICEYLDRKAQQESDTIPCFVQFLIKCMKCCLWCFERVLRYLNKALLTFSLIYNTNWWASAKLTIDVLLKDTIMVAIMNGITTFIVFLSKVVVAGLETFGFFITINYGKETAGWIMPAFIVFFLSYVVASFVLSMLTNVIDIVFVCFVADLVLT